jgi:uncharacterized protein (DUF952 family)
MEESMDQIVHICEGEAWENAKIAGIYQADSLAAEGFIHCSRLEQVIAVANRYYPGRTDLLLLWIDPLKLTADLRWEDSAGEIYPHIYGRLNLDAVSKVHPFQPDEDGVFRKF